MAKTLLGETTPVAELLAKATQLSEQSGAVPDNVCPCGCHRVRRHTVSQTVRSPYGCGFAITYFWSESCKSKWNRERMQGAG